MRSACYPECKGRYQYISHQWRPASGNGTSQQHNHKNNSQSLFHKHFLAQNEISLDEVPLDHVLVFWQTPSRPFIGVLMALAPGPDSVAGRILCTKNNQKLVFSINVILSLCSIGQITKMKGLSDLSFVSTRLHRSAQNRLMSFPAT